MRVDQDRRNPGASSIAAAVSRRGRPDNGNVGVPHGISGLGTASFAPGKANKGLAWRPALDGNPGNYVSGYIYPGKIERIALLMAAAGRGGAVIFCCWAI